MNLAHYLGSGIIMPAIYIKNKNADIQDIFKNYLLLCSSKFTENTNCAIEVVLNSNEEVPKKIDENFYLFDMPLPISRIKGIYFTSEEKKISSHFDIISGTAFIPDGLLKVSKEESIETKGLVDKKYNLSETNWSNYLKKFDQILGGFSIMKISKENFQNYPTHYFSTLGNINNLFSNIIEQQNISIENSYQFAFTDEGKFKNFHNTIYSEIDYSETERYAVKDKVKLEVKNGLIQIDKISENTQTYLVAILESYGKGKRKQVDSFVSDLISGKFVEKKKEGLSLIFGLNKGYKAFRNKYKTSNFEVDIKFDFDSKLDYYIIESIYQNVFNSLNSISSFTYIDNLFLKNKKEEPNLSNYVTYRMIDKTIIWEKKILTPSEKILDKIVEKVRYWFPSFLEVKKNEVKAYFKEDIEFFKNSIEEDLKKYFEIQTKNNDIEILKLQNTILEKNNIIANLERQVFQAELSNSHISEPNLVDKFYKINNKINGNQDSQESQSLFPDEKDFTSQENLRDNLLKLSFSTLKKKAKELKVPKYSTYKKSTDLIDEILKLNLR
jgi:hypothetical protein